MTSLSHALRLSALALLSASALAQPAPGGVATLPSVTVIGSMQPEVTETSRSYTTGSMATATGLPLSIRETPQSVSVVTRQNIEDQGLQATSDILLASPGLTATRSDSNRLSFSARGFSIDTFQFDGLASPIIGAWNYGATDMDAAIYDRVEVVRGATGLLSGSGNPSATVNFVRKRPLREFAASAALTVGRWDLRRIEADVSTPVTADGRVRARLIAAHSDSGSHIAFYDTNKRALYGVISAALTPATDLTASVEYQRNRNHGFGSGFPLFYSDGSRTDFDRSVANNTPWAYFETESTTGLLDLAHRFGNGWQARAAYSRTDGNYVMSQIFRGGYPNRDTGLGMTSTFSNYRGDRIRNDVHLSASGPLALLSRTHELSFGWMRIDDHNDLGQYRTVGALPATGSFFDWHSEHIAEPTWSDTLTLADDMRTRQSGAYAVGRFSLADPLHLIVGSRWSRWETDQNYFGALRQYEYRNVHTPYAGLVWDITPAYSAYVSYTSIFTPQNARTPDGTILDPIEGNSIEAGVKAEWLDARLNGALAVYRTKQDNLAEAIPGEVVDGTTQQAYRAVDGATVEGFDLEMTGALAPGWNVSASYTHFNAKSAAGAPINTSQPRTVARLFTTYRLPGAWNKLTLGGGVSWQARKYQNAASPNGSVRVEQGSYAVVNAMARYDFTPKVSATLNVNNLFDKTYYNQIGFYSQGWWGEPRNVMLTLRARY